MTMMVGCRLRGLNRLTDGIHRFSIYKSSFSAADHWFQRPNLTCVCVLSTSVVSTSCCSCCKLYWSITVCHLHACVAVTRSAQRKVSQYTGC